MTMMILFTPFFASLLLPADALTSSISRSTSRRTATSLDAAIGVFFGTSTGNTETVAEAIVEAFGSDVAEGPIDIDEIKGSVAAEFAKHDALIVGTPTWNTGADTERSGTGWDEIYYGEMQDGLQLQGKKVGVFGLGDSISYTENFADATGELHDVFEKLGCQMLGYTSQDGYEHEASKAIRGDLFCGLLNDMVNQDDLMPERVTKWVSQLKEEGILDASATTAAAEPEITQVNGAMAEVDPAVQTKSVEQLEAENAELRRKLEQFSQILDQNIGQQVKKDPDGFVPHFNPKSGKTMWTSPDGRKAYYTTAPPRETTTLRASPPL